MCFGFIAYYGWTFPNHFPDRIQSASIMFRYYIFCLQSKSDWSDSCVSWVWLIWQKCNAPPALQIQVWCLSWAMSVPMDSCNIWTAVRVVTWHFSAKYPSNKVVRVCTHQLYTLIWSDLLLCLYLLVYSGSSSSILHPSSLGGNWGEGRWGGGLPINFISYRSVAGPPHQLRPLLTARWKVLQPDGPF